MLDAARNILSFLFYQYIIYLGGARRNQAGAKSVGVKTG
jgi:hypothetical protein